MNDLNVEPIAAGTGNNGECYGARFDETQLCGRYAWLRVDGRRESLHVREADGRQWTVDRDTYIMDHCFAGAFLFWSRMDGWGRWSLQACRRGQETPVLIPTRGRVMSLAAAADLLVWEERGGKHTRICLLRVDDGAPMVPIEIAGDDINAYDPVVARCADGGVVVLFCVFNHGNYRICAQRLSSALHREGDPILLSDQAAPCLYPSVWPARRGGFWYSYTALDVPADHRNALASLLKHPRHLAQRDVFRWRGRAYVGLWRDGHTWSPVGSPGDQGIQAGMVVYPSVGAGHTRVFETDDGQLGLLLRRHAKPQAPDGVAPESLPGTWTWSPPNLHPNLSLCLLEGKNWSEPVALTGHLGVEQPVCLSLAGRKLAVAYDESLRPTGWGTAGEWFHPDARVGVGRLHLTLPAGRAGDMELRPFVIHRHQGNNLANPDLERRDESGFLNALGQTHAHSSLSVCCREIDRDPHVNYRFLQDVLRCDFGAVTDHDYNMTDLERLLVRKFAEYYYFPGEFVAIPAYEWTGSCIRERGGPWGHVNPLWLEEEGELDFFTPADAGCRGSTLAGLAEAHVGQKVIAPPHHPADSIHAFKWRDFDAALSPVVEIFQDCRGSGEQPGAPGVTNFLHTEEGHWALHWLRQGLRFGFIAGGDHTGLALAGAQVRELTRTALYDAFAARRTFATTGIPARVSFTASGSAMGSAIVAAAVTFRLSIATPEPMAEVEVLRDGDVVTTIHADARQFEREWSVERQRPGEFWYVRVLLTNGEIIWTSPIWLDVKEGPP